MEDTIKQLVSAGKISPAVGDRLQQLTPGQFCSHQIWGVGRVKSLDFASGKISILFEEQKTKELSLQLALKKTQPLAASEYLEKRVTDKANLLKQAKEEPVEFTRMIVTHYQENITVSGLQKELVPAIFDKETYKNWWNTTKKKMRDLNAAFIPAKQNELIKLNDNSKSSEENLILQLESTTDISEKVTILPLLYNQISKKLKKETTNEEIITTFLNTEINQRQSVLSAHVIESCRILVNLYLIAKLYPAIDIASFQSTLQLFIEKNHTTIFSQINNFPTQEQAIIFQFYQTISPKNWLHNIFQIIAEFNSRSLSELYRFTSSNNNQKVFFALLQKKVLDRSISADALIWVCQQRQKTTAKIFTYELGLAIISILERMHLGNTSLKNSRLQSYFLNEKELIKDLLSDVDEKQARSFARKILAAQTFVNLDKNSLLARIIKIHPSTHSLLMENQKKEKTLVSSQESIDKMRAELQLINNEKIPNNREDIKIARSYGDLRENAEYQMAKDEQKVLMKQKADLQRKLQQTEVITFHNPDTSKVSIGTTINISSNGDKESLTLLGAWDSDPEKNIIGYLTKIGEAILNKKIGDSFNYKEKVFTIDSIQPYRP